MIKIMCNAKIQIIISISAALLLTVERFSKNSSANEKLEV
jgi:hypothetical protein